MWPKKKELNYIKNKEILKNPHFLIILTTCEVIYIYCMVKILLPVLLRLFMFIVSVM